MNVHFRWLFELFDTQTIVVWDQVEYRIQTMKNID